MTKAGEEISTYDGNEDYTKITFLPEYKRFGMKEMEDGMFELFKKRTYDLAGVVSKKVSVYYNEKKLDIADFKAYCSFYMKGFTQKDAAEVQVAYHNQQRWELMVGVSQGDFYQVSFVNSICTTRGGTHVDYIVNQICVKLEEEAQKKCKKVKIKPSFIKNSIFVILNCQIENPAFDSQTKETLITKPVNFTTDSKFELSLSDKFYKDLIKTGVIDQIVLQAQLKEELKMQKQLKGVKKTRLFGINKLEDANKAGTKDSLKCTLILTEGDSAKALAMAGLEVVGRDYFGVFPLRGKFLNVREASNESILKNNEVSSIIEIMGLRVGMKYNEETTSSLRYGSIMIMADQDHDGSHIKGLIINFIHHFWPSLIQSNNFLKEFVTPIIKVSKGNTVTPFFTINDFKEWAEARVNNLKGWKVKYYKGLGTSDEKEAKEYFSNINIHKIDFRYQDSSDDTAVDLAFNKKKADDRKEWLANFNPNTFVDHKIKVLRYYDFIHKELIQFSVANNQRAIPNMCDGLKTGQRKILFACFKKKLVKELKVAQLSGYVAEHTEYHHGEQNLADTIVGMAQNFVGSNNINLLMPNGQFGTRAMGGKDAASPRYLFTMLNKVTRFIFLEDDDHILNYIEEDGKLVEPTFYMPIIPMALVNGSDGIGTGWSTNIPNFNPREIVENIKCKLRGEEFFKMHPYYKGYGGEIEVKDDKSYIVKGRASYNEDSNIIDITELPILKWTSDYKKFIEDIIQDKSDVKSLSIEDMREYHSTRSVFFRLMMSSEQKHIDPDNLEKILKLSSSLNLTNLVLFNEECMINKFENPQAILERFFNLRLKYYDLRKEYLASRIVRDIETLKNKIRFIREVNDDVLVISKRKKADIVGQLVTRKYTPYSKLPAIKSSIENNLIAQIEKLNQPNEEEEEEEEGQERDRRQSAPEVEDEADKGIKEYNYLLSMQILSLSEDLIKKMQKEIEDKETGLTRLRNTSVKEMWIHDLDTFLEQLDKSEKAELIEIAKDDKKAKKPPKEEINKPRKKKKVEDDEWEKQDKKAIDKEVKRSSTDEVKPEKKVMKIKGSKSGIPAQPAKSGPLPTLKSSSSTAPLTNEELDRRINTSDLSVFASNPGARERLRKIVSMTLADFEKKDISLLTLEEKIYLKELKAANEKKGATGFHKPPEPPIPRSSQITKFFSALKESPVAAEESDSSEDAFQMVKSRRQPRFKNDSDSDYEG